MSVYDDLRRLVYDKAGITLDDSKEYLLKSRLEPLAKARGVDLAELGRQARWNPQIADAVVEAMTTNETSFFRDVALWKTLTGLLPELGKGAAQRLRPLAIWSAACSSGQEAYSIAMLAKELGIRVSVYGTDIDSAVVEKAKSGSYLRMEVNRGLAARRLIQNFTQHPGDTWQVNPDIRACCSFQVANLLDRPTGGPYDLVLLRNVLIYFDDTVRRRVLAHVEAAVRPGGYLILGASESLLAVPGGFERTNLDGTTAWRRKG